MIERTPFVYSLNGKNRAWINIDTDGRPGWVTIQAMTSIGNSKFHLSVRNGDHTQVHQLQQLIDTVMAEVVAREANGAN